MDTNHSHEVRDVDDQKYILYGMMGMKGTVGPGELRGLTRPLSSVDRPCLFVRNSLSFRKCL